MKNSELDPSSLPTTGRNPEMLPIARSGAIFRPTADAPKRASPNLDAQVRTYRAQLGDWVTCPSAKTPQGKEKIAQVSAKLESVQNQIKKLDGASPSAFSQVGASVDTYA